MMNLLGTMAHGAMREHNLVSAPFKEEHYGGDSPRNTYHSKVTSVSRLERAFAVRVTSQISSDSVRGTDSRNLFPKSNTASNPSHYTEIIAHPEDHQALIDSAPYGDPEATDQYTIRHHADPFSYQLTRHAWPVTDSSTGEAEPLGRCGNEYAFDHHAQNARIVFPGTGTENRLDVIKNARLIGVHTMKAIENTGDESIGIDLAATIGSYGGHAIGNTPGILGVASGLAHGGSVAGALASTPAIAVVPAVAYGVSRLNRYNRLKSVLSGSEALRDRASIASAQAKETREFYLDQAEEKVLNMSGHRRDNVVAEWNAAKSDLKEHASDFDTMLPRYLKKLNEIDSSGGSVHRKYAGNLNDREIGVTAHATALNLANRAENRVTIKLYDLAQEAGMNQGYASSSRQRRITQENQPPIQPRVYSRSETQDRINQVLSEPEYYSRDLQDTARYLQSKRENPDPPCEYGPGPNHRKDDCQVM